MEAASTGKDGTASGGQKTGTKLKMPSSQLNAVTRAKNAVIELQTNDTLDDAAEKALEKFEDELTKLEKECEMITPMNEEPIRAKEAWMKKNVEGRRPWLMHAQSVLQARREAVAKGELPTITINDVALEIRSGRTASSLQEVEAEEAILKLQHEQMLRRRRQEDEELRLRRQREQDDLEAKLEEMRLRKQIVGSRASSRRSSLSITPALPRMTNPTAAWLASTAPGLAPASATAQSGLAPPAPRPGLRSSMRPQNELEPPLASAPSSELLTARRLCQNVLLPSSKLSVFSGNYLDFQWFMRSFELLVEEVTQDPARRMHLLLQHLEGEPYTLVAGFQLADPVLGYQLAKEELVQRYGHPVRQALAFKQKLLDWPNLRKDSAEDLRKFFVQLRLCEAMKDSSGGLDELDASTTLLHLMQKLPTKCQEAWKRRVYRIESTQVTSANYNDFTQLVKELSEVANHPVFGQHESKGVKVSTLATTGTSFPSTIMTEINSRSTTMTDVKYGTEDEPKNAFKAPCLLCQGSHPTTQCKEAANLDNVTKKERLRGLCFRCLKPGHYSRTCRETARCDVCGGRHPSILHDDKKMQQTRVDSSNVSHVTNQHDSLVKEPGHNSSNVQVPSASSNATFEADTKGSIAFSLVKVWLTPHHAVLTRAIHDTASTATFVSDKLLTKLGLNPCQRQPSSLQLTTMNATTVIPSAVVQGLSIADVNGNNPMTLPTAHTISTLPSCHRLKLLQEEVSRWPHLEDIPFDWEAATSEEDEEVGVLLGQDSADAYCPLEIRRGTGKQEPYAVRTPLGWALHGPTSLPSNVLNNFVKSSGIAAAIDRLHYHDLELVYNFRDKGLSQDDREWLTKVEGSICRSPQFPTRYQIDLPFRDNVHLKDNHDQALRQLVALSRRFRHNEKFHQDYTAFVKKMEDEGYVEEAPSLDVSSGPVSYVPHHGVYHLRKPDKLRVVFNCSSKFKGRSLNDALLPGPDMTNSLLGVLLRFRQGRVAFMADVDSMFYRVLVPPSQRDVLRYFWWPGGGCRQAATSVPTHGTLVRGHQLPKLRQFCTEKSSR